MTTDPHTATRLLFVWHLHQPYYGMPDAGDFFLPWVRLHAAKSYYDMGRMLEHHPEIRGTFNFSGSLIRQLCEISDDGRRDRWWRWSTTHPDRLDRRTRQQLVHHFFSVDADRCIKPRSRFYELYQQRHNQGISHCVAEWTDQQFLDLQVLFNLAWCGFSARREFDAVAELEDKGRQFTVDERDRLLEVQLEIVDRILPLYRRLADRDQIEITVSPMYHPIIPLVIDTESAGRATPDRPRPTPSRAPECAARPVDEALELAEDVFGARPRGIWPSEGSVSPEAIALFAEADISWIATDEAVLRHSRGNDWNRSRDLIRPWRLGDDSPRIFFRDHGLSDQIGFVYADHRPDEAVSRFVDDLHTIDDACGDEPGCVAVILDGENPWEYYEDDGRLFLDALYDRLVDDKQLVTTVPSDITDIDSGRLDHLHSGSWIDANFRIWIGHEETNDAWEWIRRADEHLRDRADTTADLEAAQQFLCIAQGSDWFWWYGDDFVSEQQDVFDALFRHLVAGVWEALGTTPPPELEEPIHTTSAGARETEITPARHFIAPTIDGRTEKYFDWVGAGTLPVSTSRSSMAEASHPIRAIRYGFSADEFFLRIEPDDDFTDKSRARITIDRPDAPPLRIDLPPGDGELPEGITAAFETVGELSITRQLLSADSGDTFGVSIAVYDGDLRLHRHPATGRFELTIPDADPGHRHWIV